MQLVDVIADPQRLLRRLLLAVGALQGQADGEELLNHLIVPVRGRDRVVGTTATTFRWLLISTPSRLDVVLNRRWSRFRRANRAVGPADVPQYADLGGSDGPSGPVPGTVGTFGPVRQGLPPLSGAAGRRHGGCSGFAAVERKR